MIGVAIKIHLFRPMKLTQELIFIFLMKFSIKIKKVQRGIQYFSSRPKGISKETTETKGSSSSLPTPSSTANVPDAKIGAGLCFLRHHVSRMLRDNFRISWKFSISHLV